jgi:hypothetical protein
MTACGMSVGFSTRMAMLDQRQRNFPQFIFGAEQHTEQTAPQACVF